FKLREFPRYEHWKTVAAASSTDDYREAWRHWYAGSRHRSDVSLARAEFDRSLYYWMRLLRVPLTPRQEAGVRLAFLMTPGPAAPPFTTALFPLPVSFLTIDRIEDVLEERNGPFDPFITGAAREARTRADRDKVRR